MCLYIRDIVKYTATSNIYVWKALLKGTPSGYYSPVFNYRYDLGETYKSELDLFRYGICVGTGLHSLGYNVRILNTPVGGYECYGALGNRFDVENPINTIGLFIIPEGSYYYTDGYFYASDTLKFLRTIPKNKFFNYMMNR